MKQYAQNTYQKDNRMEVTAQNKKRFKSNFVSNPGSDLSDMKLIQKSQEFVFS